MPLSDCDAIIFDSDGVLVDSEKIHVDVERELLAELGLFYDHETYLTRFVGIIQSRLLCATRFGLCGALGRGFSG